MSELSRRLRAIAGKNDRARWTDCLDAAVDELIEAADEIDRLQAIIDSLNRLREDEGNAVTFICPNPDFDGQPDEAIEVCAEWTGWEPRRFTGNTLAECLQAAEKARAQ